MKQIRNSVFETNSSSTHSVSISNLSNFFNVHDLIVNKFNNKVWCTFGEFGWEQESYVDPYNKLSYLLTMIAQFLHMDIWCNQMTEEDINEKIMESEDFIKLNELIKNQLNCDGIYIEASEGYIDHQSCEGYTCIDDFLKDWGLDSIEQFIFDTSIALKTDNDNHY